jgi:hypothetical protein
MIRYGVRGGVDKEGGGERYVKNKEKVGENML